MSDPLDAQIGSYEHRLDHLLRDGSVLRRGLLGRDLPLDGSLDAMRAWQRECAATIGQLSGGSKQHWLSRAYSDAFLPRPDDAALREEVIQELPIDVIVQRIMAVLRDARASLSSLRGGGAAAPAALAAPRFSFVHDAALRPRLEQAFADAQVAFDRQAHALALVTWASILEAILTDALTNVPHAAGEPIGQGIPLTSWPFDARIAVAERTRVISGACARLPEAARRYRELLDESGELRADAGVTEQEARLAGQVLRLVMRDLAPGR
jgi:hypothetical protein